MRIYLLFVLFISVFPLYASKIAQAIIVKGKVEIKDPDTKTRTIVTEGLWAKERSILSTGQKSFVKLLFKDKSQMNIGPLSQMQIERFSPKKSNVIKLIKGHLRAKISKNYMEKKSTQLKLFVKTKNAGIGVRGTDFQVNYNPNNNHTSLITFEGTVVMTKIERQIFEKNVEQHFLERLLSSQETVSVRQGQYSGAMPQQEKVTIPIKLNPAQFKVLKSNESGIEEVETKVKSVTPKQSYKSVVPPNINSKVLANNSQELEKQMTKIVGKNAVSRILENTKQSNLDNVPPPEGMIDNKTGQIAPTAGGLIDLKTAQYIPPPKGSLFDPSTQTYIPSISTGTFDPKSGHFYNPNYKLTDDGRFIPKDNLEEDRRPAANEQAPLPPPPPSSFQKNLIPMNKPIVIGSPDIGLDKEDLEEMIKNVANENENNISDHQDIFIETQTTKLKVYFNVK